MTAGAAVDGFVLALIAVRMTGDAFGVWVREVRLWTAEVATKVRLEVLSKVAG